MNNLRSRLQRLMNESNLENKDQRELERIGDGIKDFLEKNNTLHEEFDFSNWTGACAAFGKAIEVNTNNHNVLKDGTKIPASEILKKQKQYFRRKKT